jgi:hypothetical protein
MRQSANAARSGSGVHRFSSPDGLPVLYSNCLGAKPCSRLCPLPAGLNCFVTEVTDFPGVLRLNYVVEAGRASCLLEKFMKTNVGTIDRVLRILAGMVLIGLAAAGIIGLWGYIGVVVLLTGLFRFCPAYPLLGINTCGLKQK